MYQLYRLNIDSGISHDAAGDLSMELRPGQQVIVQCDRYQDLARIEHRCPQEPADLPTLEEKLHQKSKGRQLTGQHLPVIHRLATQEDLLKAQANASRLEDVHTRTIERIQAHQLGMKLIHEHYSIDRKLLILQFTSDGRVDFRELIRDLSTLFHCRVELRQVGVRDETSIVGGLGSCGRPFCCATFLHSIASVNVKTAKQQGLSLNPQNISGCCGRLKCCLQFEADEYQNCPRAPKRPTPPPAAASAQQPAKPRARQFRPPKETPPPSANEHK